MEIIEFDTLFVAINPTDKFIKKDIPNYVINELDLNKDKILLYVYFIDDNNNDEHVYNLIFENKNNIYIQSIHENPYDFTFSKTIETVLEYLEGTSIQKTGENFRTFAESSYQQYLLKKNLTQSIKESKVKI